MRIKQIVKKTTDILRMIKFSHTLFALPFALSAIVLLLYTNQNWTWSDMSQKIGLVLLCMVFARSAAMSFNRIADHKLDAKNPRTKDRELVTGKLNLRQVGIFNILMAIGFIITTYFINNTVFYCSPLALGLIYSYSLIKRYNLLCHLYLGFVIGLVPLSVNLALFEIASLISIVLGMIIMFWMCGFDIIYALPDIEFDQKTGLHSIPSRLGAKNGLLVSRICYSLALLAMIAIYFLTDIHFIYFTGVIIIAGLLVYEHILVKPNDFSKVDKAFFTMNSYVSVIYFTFVLISVLMK